MSLTTIPSTLEDTPHSLEFTVGKQTYTVLGLMEGDDIHAISELAKISVEKPKIPIIYHNNKQLYKIPNSNIFIFAPEGKEILKIYKAEVDGKRRVRFTDGTWGLRLQSGEWEMIVPPEGKEIAWMGSINKNGYREVLFTDGTYGFRLQSGEWKMIAPPEGKKIVKPNIAEDNGDRQVPFKVPEGKEIEKVYEVESDGNRRVQFKDNTWGLCLKNGEWFTYQGVSVFEAVWHVKGSQYIIQINGTSHLVDTSSVDRITASVSSGVEELMSSPGGK